MCIFEWKDGMSLITPKNEHGLVKELSKGNLLAFNALYKEYSVRLYRFAFGYLKSKEEAEELVQEVFTIIWDKRKELRAELSFRSFLFTISFNMIRKHFRTKAHLAEFIRLQEGTGADSSTGDDLNFQSLLEHIKKLVDQLPDRRREIFQKSRFDGLTIQEIADELNISHKTVENQLTEALRFLRTHLNQEALPLILFFALFLS
jgi:RNA polymerase sigma-70 factor (ECF subfamily)